MGQGRVTLTAIVMPSEAAVVDYVSQHVKRDWIHVYGSVPRRRYVR